MNMGNRKQHRAEALTGCIQGAVEQDPKRFHKNIIKYVLAFFTVIHTTLIRYEDVVFETLRHNTWEIDEEEYKDSFSRTENKGNDGNGEKELKAMGDLGYSGSTFFKTADSKFVIKSLPRHFEYKFFKANLIQPYYDHMSTHPDSFLIRITDYVYAPYANIGNLLKITPSNHVIMENLMYGRETDPAKNQWEAYDLKPLVYFYPQRELRPSPLVTETVLRKTVSVFKDKIRISRTEYELLRRVLEEDTLFLQLADTVDYSFFLVRFPASSDPPAVVGRKTRWRVGFVSTDRKWKYRGAILDFFWSRHNFRTHAMSGAVRLYNVVGHRGPMTVTTTPVDYREKFLALVDNLVEVLESSGSDERT